MPYRIRIKEKVVVHTKDGRSILGVLLAVYRANLVLTHAQLLHESEPEAQGTPLAGDIILERSNVSFVQSGL